MQRPPIDAYLQYSAQLDSIFAVLGAAALLIFIVVPKRRLAERVINGITEIPISLPLLPNRLFWALLTPLAALLRLPLMNASLWYDETFTANMAAIPSLAQLGTAIMGDVHPLGFYLVEWLFVRLFGESSLVLRLPSFIAGITLIWLVHRLAWRLTGDRAVAQLAAAITAVLPAMIYYSAEARYPALLACLIIASMIALLENKPLVFVVTAGLIAWIHSLGLPFAGLLVIVALTRIRHNPYWLSGGLITALLAGLQVPTLLQQSGDVANGFWLPNTIPIWHIVDMTVRRAATSLPVALFTWSTPLVLSIVGGWTFRRSILKHPMILIVMVGMPILLWAGGLVWHPVYLSRALIAPALVLVIAWSHFLLRSKSRVRWVLGAALVVTLAITNGKLYTEDRSPVDDLLAYCNGADYVYTTSTNMTIQAMANSGIPVIAWDAGNNMHQSLPESAKLAMGMNFTPLDQLRGDVCLIYQLSYYTTDAELNQLNRIRLRYLPRTEDQYIDSQMISYTVMRFEAW